MATVVPSYTDSDLPPPPPYSKEEDVKIQAAAAKVFAEDPKIVNALEIDIETLTKCMKDTEEDFRTISQKLGEIDKKQLTSTKYQGTNLTLTSNGKAWNPEANRRERLAPLLG